MSDTTRIEYGVRRNCDGVIIVAGSDEATCRDIKARWYGASNDIATVVMRTHRTVTTSDWTPVEDASDAP